MESLALSIAARKGGVLHLETLTGRQWSEAVAMVAKAARPGHSVVVLGGGGELNQSLAQQLGSGDSVLWVEGTLEDLRTDPAALATLLSQSPATDLASYKRLQAALELQRREHPLVPDGSRDVVLLEGLTHMLSVAQLKGAAREAFRVLRRSGSFTFSVLLVDEPISCPDEVALEGLPLEKEAADLLADVGYHGISYLWRAQLPWKIVEGREIRAFVLQAFKGKQGPCIDQGHAVIYKGPWREVLDDDGHRYVRGERTAVCKKTYALLSRAPYQGQFMGLVPYVLVPEEQAPLFDCSTPALRAPEVTKGTRSVLDEKEKGSARSGDCSGEDCC